MLKCEVTTLFLALSCLLQTGFCFVRPAAGSSGSCLSTQIKSMKAYDCVGLNLGDVPQNLASSTQVLDLSINRIRKLTNSSFRKYTSLRKLFLNDNMIVTIETGTFDGLNKLDTLDLSMNALLEVPISIFHLPSLNKLALSENLRLDVTSLIESSLPVTAPIKDLDLSSSPLLTRLPQMGSFVALIHLNVSGNNITELSVNSFIGLCNLKYFTSSSATLRFNSSCECRQLQVWMDYAEVSSKPAVSRYCDILNYDCTANVGLSKEVMAAHESCRSRYKTKENLRSAGKILSIVVAVLGGMLLFVGICYIWYRFQRLPELPKKPALPQIENDKTASLLAPFNNDNT